MLVHSPFRTLQSFISPSEPTDITCARRGAARVAGRIGRIAAMLPRAVCRPLRRWAVQSSGLLRGGRLQPARLQRLHAFVWGVWGSLENVVLLLRLRVFVCLFVL